MPIISNKNMNELLEEERRQERLSPAPEERRLLDNKGRLLVNGRFSEEPPPFDRSSVPLARRLTRLRETDSYTVMSDSLCMAVTAGEIGCTGFVSVTLVNLSEDYEMSRTRYFPLTFGSMEMPGSPSRDDVMVRRRDVSLDMTRSPDARHIRCRFDGFDDMRDLYVNLEMRLPPVIPVPNMAGQKTRHRNHTPPGSGERGGEQAYGAEKGGKTRSADAYNAAYHNIANDTYFPSGAAGQQQDGGGTRGASVGEYFSVRPAAQRGSFVYSAHTPCMLTTGTVVLGADRCEFSADECYTSFDWMRAALPGYTHSASMTVCGGMGGSRLGITLSEDGTMLHDEGHMMITDPFEPKVDEWGEVLPFGLATPDGRVELRFTPIADHRHYSKGLVMATRSERFVFGTATGICRPDDGGAVSFRDVYACLRLTDERW